MTTEATELRALLAELEAAKEPAPPPRRWAFIRGQPPSRGVALLPAIRRAITKLEEEVKT